MSTTSNVSIIIAVYNSEKYIGQAVESILNQSFQNFEFIILDDASTDSSYEICQRYSQWDTRIKLFKNKQNMWVVKTRNKLLNLVSKDIDYIMILDADDIAYRDRLQKQMDFLDTYRDISVVWSDIDIINENGKKIGKRTYPHTYEEISKTIFQKSPLAQPSVMLRKRDIDKLWWYNTDFERCQDYDLWCRFFHIGYKLANIPEVLTEYRVSSQQWKSQYLKLTLKNTVKIQKRYIFQRQYISLWNTLYFIAEKIIWIFPDGFILWVFKKTHY